jgi:hypothetical protein
MSQTYLVAQWRGTDTGHRAMGTGLPESAAIRRIALVGRLFPDYARPKAYAEQLGNTDVLAVVRTYQ